MINVETVGSYKITSERLLKLNVRGSGCNDLETKKWQFLWTIREWYTYSRILQSQFGIFDSAIRRSNSFYKRIANKTNPWEYSCRFESSLAGCRLKALGHLRCRAKTSTYSERAVNASIETRVLATEKVKAVILTEGRQRFFLNHILSHMHKWE